MVVDYYSSLTMTAWILDSELSACYKMHTYVANNWWLIFHAFCISLWLAILFYHRNIKLVGLCMTIKKHYNYMHTSFRVSIFGYFFKYQNHRASNCVHKVGIWTIWCIAICRNCIISLKLSFSTTYVFVTLYCCADVSSAHGVCSIR